MSQPFKIIEIVFILQGFKCLIHHLGLFLDIVIAIFVILKSNNNDWLVILILDFTLKGDTPIVPAVSYTHLDVYKRQTFPRFAKIKVNGKEAEPLFDWLKKEKSGPLGARIEWNFAKFLINREGKVVERFSSKTDPLKLEEAINTLLNN